MPYRGGGCQTVKVVVLGDSGVGKSSIVSQYFDERFDPHYKATIGMDFRHGRIDVPDGSGRPSSTYPVQLAVWDTAGQERFHALGTAYYRGADACVLVFDLTSAASFHHVTSWLEEFYMHTDNRTCILIGNKRDLLPTPTERGATATTMKDGSGGGQVFPYHSVASCAPPPYYHSPRSSASSSFTSSSTTAQPLFLQQQQQQSQQQQPSLSSLAEAWCVVQNKNRTALRGDIRYYEVSAKTGGKAEIHAALLALLTLITHPPRRTSVTVSGSEGGGSGAGGDDQPPLAVDPSSPEPLADRRQQRQTRGAAASSSSISSSFDPEAGLMMMMPPSLGMEDRPRPARANRSSDGTARRPSVEDCGENLPIAARGAGGRLRRGSLLYNHNNHNNNNNDNNNNNNRNARGTVRLNAPREDTASGSSPSSSCFCG